MDLDRVELDVVPRVSILYDLGHRIDRFQEIAQTVQICGYTAAAADPVGHAHSADLIQPFHIFRECGGLVGRIACSGLHHDLFGEMFHDGALERDTVDGFGKISRKAFGFVEFIAPAVALAVSA